jgi:hypothetical protein
MEFFLLGGLCEGQGFYAGYFGNKHGIEVLSEMPFTYFFF